MIFENPALNFYKVQCQTLTETRTSIKSLTVVQSGSIVVQNVSYQEFPKGKVEISLALENPLISQSPELIPKLYECFLQRENSRKISRLEISKKSNKSVIICAEHNQNLPSNQYSIGVVSKSLDKVKPSLQSTTFIFQGQKRPEILEAIYRPNGRIHVHFDVKIQCLKPCKATLKAEPALKEGWSCQCARNKLIISLEEDEDLESPLPQKLIFLENNGVVQKGSNLQALPVLQGQNITIRHREGKKLEVRVLEESAFPFASS